MNLFRNRIVISLLIIFGLAAYWEFGGKSWAGPLYVQAADEYKKGNYEESLKLLDRAYQLDPNDATTLTLYGWNHLKLKHFTEATAYFERALKLQPDLVDARRGLAHCWLELGQPDRALDSFEKLPPEMQALPEVRVAMARAYRTRGENQKAATMLSDVLNKDPKNIDALAELERLAGADDPAVLAAMQASRVRPATLQVAARLEGGYFQVREGNTWKQLYIAGVNIGPARPGHFVSEPPLKADIYLDWLESIDRLNANAIRVYTLLPPAFYQALWIHNTKNPDRPLYLFQEIWMKEPPDRNLYDKAFITDFETEIYNLVDVVHGNATLAAEPGRPGGIYAADVSPWTVGWLVGREIEPSVVAVTNARSPGARSFDGRYLKISDGNATEVWLTRMCNKVVEYEVEKYNWQRPVSWVSWPPLDPLYHPSESSLDEEWQVRRAKGEQLPPLRPGVTDDIDAVSLDEEKVSPTAELKSGYFATSHVYPFYPDFIIHDAKYRVASDKKGVNSYWGYLKDLKAHYRKTPLLVAEYGLSTSVGIAHFNPYGWNHGGVEEGKQGEDMVRLTENIRDAGFAGGIAFEWVDEWWKHNWIAYDFEQPFYRSALWLNDMDPEQHFGLQKFIPAAPLQFQEVYQAPTGSSPEGLPYIERVRWAADPSALYLRLQLSSAAGSTLDWKKANYAVALNTCGRPCGSRTVPVPGVPPRKAPDGFNFLLRLGGPNATRLLAARSYNPYREVRVGGMPQLTDVILLRNQKTDVTEVEEFEEIVVETNRRRYGRDGTFYPSERYSRSVLLQGTFDYGQPGYNSVAQWYYDAASREIRVRLSWGLLLVMDPSSGIVYSGTDADAKPIGLRSDHISLAAFAYAPAQNVPPQFVPGGTDTLDVVSIVWPRWEAVDYKQVPKKSFEILRPQFEKLTGRRARGR
ncbi:MAG TPA: tetratricopeptide repeat protein [Candidatus Acidoferrales bacterium]|nr:tetratricopeptide repeat protein [Candidatus Acidoferrales bacterium]